MSRYGYAFYLNWMYWHPKILSDLARVVGVPLRIDANTLHGEFGRYARLLVDVDLTEEMPGVVLLNQEGKEIEVPLWYENVPAFCIECSSIGHHREECKKLVKEQQVEAPDKRKQDDFNGELKDKVWRKKEVPRQETGQLAAEKPLSPGKVVEKGDCSKYNEGKDFSKFSQYNIFEELVNEDLAEESPQNSRLEGTDEEDQRYCSDSEHTDILDFESEEEVGTPTINICLDAKSASSSKKKKVWRRGRLTKTERRKRLQARSEGLTRPTTRAVSNSSQ